MSQFDELPEGWIWATFQDILIKVKRGPSKKCNTDGKGIRYITSGNLANGFLDLALDYKFLDDLEGIEKCILLPGDLILNCVNSLERIGKSAVFQESHGEAIVGFNNYGIELRQCLVNPQYLNFFCQGQIFKDQVFFSVKRAVNQVSFATRELNQLNVSLPPLNEQRRIVEKIEALTARSRKARAALDEIPVLLDQFRQSVLAAAFRGDLTADWRAQNPDVEPAEALLERIRVERRDRWEAAELEKMKAKGKEPKDSKWKEKYKEPDFNQEVFDLKSEFEVENNDWAFAHLELLVEPDRGIPYGIVQTGLETVDGIPTVRCGDIKNFKIGIENLKLVDPRISENYEKTLLKGYEVLIAIRGTVGAVAIATPEMKGMNISREVAMVTLLSGLERKYVMYLLSSPIGSSILSRYIKGVAQSGINLNDLRSLPVPIPSEAEQKEIVNRIEMLLSISNQHEEMICGSFNELDQIDQSILAKAFRGQLVPQDPTDEPAAVLLDRIRSERERLGSGKKRGKAKG